MKLTLRKVLQKQFKKINKRDINMTKNAEFMSEMRETQPHTLFIMQKKPLSNRSVP